MGEKEQKKSSSWKRKNMKKQVLGFHVYNCKFSEAFILNQAPKKPDEELIFWKDFLTIIFFG